jgi:hypothetical protein
MLHLNNCCREGDGDPLGRPVRQKRHGQQISLKAQHQLRSGGQSASRIGSTLHSSHKEYSLMVARSK